MPQKKWIVIVDWIDGAVTDSDEVVVYAETGSAALSKARERWRMAVGLHWPSCRIESAWVLTPEKERLIC